MQNVVITNCYSNILSFSMKLLLIRCLIFLEGTGLVVWLGLCESLCESLSIRLPEWSIQKILVKKSFLTISGWFSFY